MKVEIRRAEVGDAEMLADISCKTFYDTFTGTCTEEDMEGFLKQNFNLPLLKQQLENPDNFFYLAFADGLLAGYCFIKEDYSHFEKMREWKALELKRIYVQSSYIGKGVAQALMDFIFAFAEEKKFEAVWLGVWEHNYRAQKFYAKYGFENSGVTHPFPIGNTPQTDFWLWKFLKK